MLRVSIIIHFGQFGEWLTTQNCCYYSVLVCFNYSTLSSGLRSCAGKELCLPALSSQLSALTAQADNKNNRLLKESDVAV